LLVSLFFPSTFLTWSSHLPSILWYINVVFLHLSYGDAAHQNHGYWCEWHCTINLFNAVMEINNKNINNKYKYNIN
jgi:hypothetical protein